MGYKGSRNRVTDFKAFDQCPLWANIEKAKLPTPAARLYSKEYCDHDFPEDAAHENGNYINECSDCNVSYIGHKRRLTCKVCDIKAEERWAKMSEKEREEQMRVVGEQMQEFFAKAKAEEEAAVQAEKDRIQAIRDRAHFSNCGYLGTKNPERCTCKGEGGDWVIGRRGPRQLGAYDG